MVNFTDAVKQGIAAAIAEDNERLEIQSVINELADTVNEISDGSATVRVEERAIKTSNEFMHSVMFMLSRNRYKALLVVPQNSASQKHEIARWSQETAGYPVKIGVANEELICPDKMALKEVLAQLATSSIIGRAINLIKAADARQDASASPGKLEYVVTSPDQAPELNVPGEIIERPFGVGVVREVVSGQGRAKLASAKSAAIKKPVKKAAASPLATKVASKPVTKKAVAKPSAVKPSSTRVTKTSASKAPAKPVAEKLIIKTEVSKPLLSKVSAKPAATKPSAVRVTKSSVEKVVVKPPPVKRGTKTVAIKSLASNTTAKPTAVQLPVVRITKAAEVKANASPSVAKAAKAKKPTATKTTAKKVAAKSRAAGASANPSASTPAAVKTSTKKTAGLPLRH
jgi:hypothetical protein